MASILTSAELFSGEVIGLGDLAPGTTVRELKALVAAKCTIVSSEIVVAVSTALIRVFRVATERKQPSNALG